ncbi:MAG: PIN domain-containing protein [Candidatus Sumerlaeota bacterium]|nr:PIN domain-containing protein [Candidatus Sumerlaeota bacterium]
MKPLFLDTGYVIALEALDDRRHPEAVAHWRLLVPHRPQLVTTSLVFSEIVTFFNSRGRHDKAAEIGERLLRSPSVRLVHVDADLFTAGWAYLKGHQDKAYSFTDCVSFALMEAEGLMDALAFDAHFERAGFNRLPAMAR